MRRVFFSVLLFFSLIVFVSCQSRHIATTLDEIESYIQSHPDSALTVLRTLDTTTLKTRKLKAHYALLHAMALDKNWIDTTDVSVVMPAVEYYEKHGTADQKLKSLLYLGRIQYFNNRPDSAIISYMKAERETPHSTDELSKGLLSMAIADIYCDAHSLDKALSYIESAMGHFMKAKDTSRLSQTEGRLAMIFQEQQEWQKADSLFIKTIDNIADSTYLWIYLSQYAAMKVVQPDPDPSGAISLLSRKYSGKGSLNARDYGVYAYASALSGDDDRCNQILSMLSRNHSHHPNQAEYMEYRIAEYRKDYAQALSLLKKIYTRQDTLVYEILGHSVSQTLQDYYEKESVEKQRRLTEQRMNGITISFLLLVLLLVFVLWMRQKREREREAAEKTIRAAEEVNKMLRQAKDSLETDMSRMQSSFVHFYKNQLERIGSLCEVYTKNKGRTDLGKQEAVYRRVERIVDEINKDDENFALFETEVNRYFNNVLDHLKADLAKKYTISALDARFICFSIAGFDANTLSVLLGISMANVYTRRSRLKDRIRTMDSPYKEQYLHYLSA